MPRSSLTPIHLSSGKANRWFARSSAASVAGQGLVSILGSLRTVRRPMSPKSRVAAKPVKLIGV
mgnify:CR=1 FL=1